MKVATPDWLVKSVEARALLPWYTFRYESTTRVDASQGKKAPQMSLLNNFLSQAAPQHSMRSAESASKETETSVIPNGDNLLGRSTLSVDITAPSTSSHLHDIPETVPSPSTPQRLRSNVSTSPPTTPTRPLFTTDPTSPEQASRTPGYAADRTNIAAQRAMADPAWRAAHTSVAPDFIEGYYRNSRLHHLSAWKAELKDLVSEAQELAESGRNSSEASMGSPDLGDSPVSKVVRENMDGKNWTGSNQGDAVSMKGARLVKGKGKEKTTDSGERVIMHCDFDSFFVSAGLVDRPHLKGKPVVVCHSQGAQGGQSSTSEIASASYEARKFGVKSGMRYVAWSSQATRQIGSHDS